MTPLSFIIDPLDVFIVSVGLGVSHRVILDTLRVIVFRAFQLFKLYHPSSGSPLRLSLWIPIQCRVPMKCRRAVHGIGIYLKSYSPGTLMMLWSNPTMMYPRSLPNWPVGLFWKPPDILLQSVCSLSSVCVGGQEVDELSGCRPVFENFGGRGFLRFNKEVKRAECYRKHYFSYWYCFMPILLL